MAQVHRFCDSVAIFTGSGSTVYFDHATAAAIGRALIAAAADVVSHPFTESKFASASFPNGVDSMGAAGSVKVARGGALPVIFRKHFIRELREWRVTAAFPTLAGNSHDWRDVTTFDLAEGHGAASPEWFKKGRPATESEYLPILAELRSIYGREEKHSPAFNLVIYEKFHSFFNERRRVEWKKGRGK